MQKILILLSFLFILGFQNQLIGQSKNFTKSFSLQLSLGSGESLHYFAPVQMRFCFEGCPTEKQEARSAQLTEIALIRQFKPNQAYLFGIATSRYQFYEKGFSSPGLGLFPYERTVLLSWLHLQLGHRYTFWENAKNSFFLENGISSDFRAGRESNYFKNLGFSYRLRLGFQYELMEEMKIFLNGFYKTAITKFNKEKIGENNYFPYSYGIEIGGSAKLFKKKK